MRESLGVQKKINWETRNLVKYMFKKEQFKWNDTLLVKKFVQDFNKKKKSTETLEIW